VFDFVINEDLQALYKAQDAATEIVPCTNDPEVYFPTPGDGNSLLAAARKGCASCPILNQCAEYALKHEPDHGIWGGLTVKERDQIRAYRNKQKVA